MSSQNDAAINKLKNHINIQIKELESKKPNFKMRTNGVYHSASRTPTNIRAIINIRQAIELLSELRRNIESIDYVMASFPPEIAKELSPIAFQAPGGTYSYIEYFKDIKDWTECLFYKQKINDLKKKKSSLDTLRSQELVAADAISDIAKSIGL